MVMPFFVTYLPAKKILFFKNIQHIIFAVRNAAEIERCVAAKKTLKITGSFRSIINRPQVKPGKT
jgi:hypothetical protein